MISGLMKQNNQTGNRRTRNRGGRSSAQLCPGKGKKGNKKNNSALTLSLGSGGGVCGKDERVKSEQK